MVPRGSERLTSTDKKMQPSMEPLLSRRNRTTSQDTESINSQWTDVSVHSLIEGHEQHTEHSTGNEPWMRAVTNLEDEVESRFINSQPSGSSTLPHMHSPIVTLLPIPQTQQYRPLSPASSVATVFSSLFRPAAEIDAFPLSPNPSVSSNATLVDSSVINLEPNSRGERVEVYYPRGITSSAGSREEQDKWLSAIQTKLHYAFRNPALLEEALESCGSGVTVVGNGTRAIQDGNLGLAAVGERSLKLMFEQQAYERRLTIGGSAIPFF